jgi:FixJ family two-component response regulator
MMDGRPLVTIVDDDESVRESLPDLLTVLGYEVRAFSSAAAFLASEYVTKTKCLVLDIAMPDMSGPELARELGRMGHKIPVIFITAHRDELSRPRVLAQGAVAGLIKPFSDTAIAGALETALRTHHE